MPLRRPMARRRRHPLHHGPAISLEDTMSNLIRYEPLGDTLPELFRGFFSPVRFGTEEALPQMKIDVSETDQNYLVRADLPGVSKEDISVLVEGNQVTISAEVREDKEEKTKKMLRRERSYGRVSRSFTLAHDVEQARSAAKYANGVLELTLPKTETTRSRRVQVQ
jgi:HSP20 family protein